MATKGDVMGKRRKSAFAPSFRAGLVAPLALYAPPVVYTVPTQAYSAAAAFGAVGALLSSNLAAAKTGKTVK